MPPKSLAAAEVSLSQHAEQQLILSTKFNDIYHSHAGALKQADYVFLQGCQLPERWQHQTSYTILETGFGLGVNALACWLRWQQDSQRCQQLHFVSIERYPFTKQQLAQFLPLLADYQQIQALAEQLIERYPEVLLPGIQNIYFNYQRQFNFCLSLVFGDIAEVLPSLVCQADSLFLDGFSPPKNPQMWQDKVIKELATKVKKSATVATWCVASSVTSVLKQHHFRLQKRRGLPPKRHCLTAQYEPPFKPKPTIYPSLTNAKQAIVIGAGLAGASICWQLAKRGWQTNLIEQNSAVAMAASAVPLAVAAPNFSADDNLSSQLTRAGLLYLKQFLSEVELDPTHWQADGVLQILANATNLPANQQFLAQPNWLQFCHTATNRPAIFWPQALHLDMQQLTRQCLAKCQNLELKLNCKITSIKQHADLWHVYAEQQFIASAPVLILANALACTDLLPTSPALQLQAVRGQMLFGEHLTVKLEHPINGAGHLVPALSSHNQWQWGIGSSYELNDLSCAIRASSNQQLLNKLDFLLPQHSAALKTELLHNHQLGFANIRACSKDHLPLIGPMFDWQRLTQIPKNKWQLSSLPKLPNLYLMTGLASRGLTLAPLGAELLASYLNQQPLPVLKPLAAAVDPARFIMRLLRKNSR